MKSKIMFNISVMLARFLIVINTILMTVTYLNRFEKDVLYFKSSTLTRISFLALGISVLIFAVGALLYMKKDSNPAMPKELTYAPDPILAVFFALGCVVPFINSGFKLFPVVIALLSLAGLIYSLIPEKKENSVKSFLAITSMFFPVAIIAYTYFDMTTPINSEMVILTQFAAISASLGLAADMRTRLGTITSRSYFCLSAVAAILCSAVSISYIVAYFAGSADNREYFRYSLILAVYFINAVRKSFVAVIVNSHDTSVDVLNAVEDDTSDDTCNVAEDDTSADTCNVAEDDTSADTCNVAEDDTSADTCGDDGNQNNNNISEE